METPIQKLARTHPTEARGDAAAEEDESGDREHGEHPPHSQLERKLRSSEKLQRPRQWAGKPRNDQRADERAGHDARELEVVELAHLAGAKQQQVVRRLQVETLLDLGVRAIVDVGCGDRGHQQLGHHALEQQLHCQFIAVAVDTEAE